MLKKAVKVAKTVKTKLMDATEKKVAKTVKTKAEIDNIFNGYDSTESDLPINRNFSSPLYPLEEHVYRIANNEQIITPAGTFECTVIEAVNYSGVLKKLWMVNDKIGVYAKIIEEDTDENFGHYYIYELQKIK